MPKLSLRSLLVGILLISPTTARGASDAPPPPAPREFRAVWVATVANIDWPSKPGLSADEQKREALAILDCAAALRLNAVVLQVRTACDALYRSSLEPWSYYLTGEQGKPQPEYDPLEFWVEEAHRRGLVLHAWFNPFRARLGGAKYDLHPSHVGRAQPDWVKTYGTSLWLDPAQPEARRHTLRVVADVVRRYDVDGIHIDDYFYPYPIADSATGKEIDFPDEPAWQAYRRDGGTLQRGDWRRDNVSRLVEEMYRTIHREKPRVLFGVSPFGIPRPGEPKGVVGFDQYAKLYADTVLWLRSGWCDYWSPQLYWKVHAPGQPFEPLLSHWVQQNVKGRHMWPGLSVSRVGDAPKGYDPEEILEQIAVTRRVAGASGNVLFSAKALTANRRGLSDRLSAGPYAQAALLPLTPWIAGPAPNSPKLSPTGGGVKIEGGGPASFLWAVWTRADAGWTFHVLPARQRILNAGDPLLTGAQEIVVSAVDQLGAESPRASLRLRPRNQQ